MTTAVTFQQQADRISIFVKLLSLQLYNNRNVDADNEREFDQSRCLIAKWQSNKYLGLLIGLSLNRGGMFNRFSLEC